MKIQGAIIKEQGVTFAIVVVKKSAMPTDLDAEKTRAAFQLAIRDFSGIPLILASQDSSGDFEYQGRQDIVELLASIDASQIPWMEYIVS